ncbi:unnamed protein product [Chrysoparadoxa australica]
MWVITLACFLGLNAVSSGFLLCAGPSCGNGNGLHCVAGVEDAGVLQKKLSGISNRLVDVRGLIDEEKLLGELEYLQGVSAEGDFWDAADEATATLTKLSKLQRMSDRLSKWKRWEDDAETALELLGEADPSERSAMLTEAGKSLEYLEADLEEWELEKLLSGTYDEAGVRLTIQAGAGGTDAQDWALMLQRMYIRYFQRKGFKYNLIEEESGEVAGIKSCMLEAHGEYCYGLLAGEKGAHRLVRQSPFNAQSKRQTSFAGVETFPILPEDDLKDLVIPEAELEVTTMRSGGKGGQNVNKVETGVRMKHLPSGLAVKCTQERTQAMNKELALKMLKARLLVVMQEQRAAELAEIRGDMVEASWGQQIRSYVFHPYKMVKDIRTDAETAQVQDVMDGDLDMFVEGYLRFRSMSADD